MPDIICNECVFFNDKVSDCKIGKLSLLISKGIEVVYEDNKVILKDKICRCFRGALWATNKNSEDYLDIIEKENKLRVCAVVVLEAKHNMQDVRNCLKNIMAQSDPFCHVLLFDIGTNTIKPISLLHIIKESRLDIPWSIEKNVDDIQDIYDIDIICPGIKNITCHYITLIDPSKPLNTDYNSELNHIVNVDMDVVGLIEPESEHYHGITFFKQLYLMNNMKWYGLVGDGVKYNFVERIKLLPSKYPIVYGTRHEQKV